MNRRRVLKRRPDLVDVIILPLRGSPGRMAWLIDVEVSRLRETLRPDPMRSVPQVFNVTVFSTPRAQVRAGTNRSTTWRGLLTRALPFRRLAGRGTPGYGEKGRR